MISMLNLYIFYFINHRVKPQMLYLIVEDNIINSQIECKNRKKDLVLPEN